MLQTLKKSELATFYLDLAMARLMYRKDEIEGTVIILDQIAEKSESLPALYYILRFLCSLKQRKNSDALESAAILLQPEKLLDNLYQCQKCNRIGNWLPVCCQCGQTHSYAPRMLLENNNNESFVSNPSDR